MQRRLAAENLAKACEAVETEREPAEKILSTAKRLHRKKTHYVPAPPPLAATLATAK